jgi:hypothetical protein
VMEDNLPLPSGGSKAGGLVGTVGTGLGRDML